MRRWATVLIAMALVTVASACFPQPASTVVITSIVVSPDPVVAGAPFTVTVTATDPVDVRAMLKEFRATPPFWNDGSYIPPVTSDDPPITAAPAVTQVFTCTLGTLAPNGRWAVMVSVSNGDSSYWTQQYEYFQVTGGSDDLQPPTVVSQTFSPSPVVAGQPFAYTLRVSDDHLAAPAPTTFYFANIVDPQASNPPPRVSWDCGPTTPVVITPTVEEFDFTGCEVGAGAALGTYGGFMAVKDTIGNQLAVWPEVEVVAPA